MELAQSLVRSAVRSFYDTKHILVIDALILHSTLRDDDLAYLMGMQPKELHKLCGKLREGRFLAVHTRAELKAGQQKPMNRTYYYIDYRATIDAIKWRAYCLNKKVQGNTVKEDDRKVWFCTRCKSEYTQLQVLDMWDGAVGFRCQRCRNILTGDHDNNRGGHEQSTKYHAQFKFITEVLPKIDEVVIPENTFDKALAMQLKVIRDEHNPASDTAPIEALTAKPSAVHGMKNTPPSAIAVTITTSEGQTEAEATNEKARRAQLAEANAMPQHFTHSTVTGEQVKGLQATSQASLSLEPDTKKQDVDTPSANGDGAEIDDYFARLKAEQAKEAEQEQNDEYETDDDEDEDDFEDVPTGSGVATPASAFGDSKATPTPSQNGIAGVLKRGGSVSGSGTSTVATSPVTGPDTPNEDGRPLKRVRIEEPAAPVKVEDESEEDMEFEDV